MNGSTLLAIFDSVYMLALAAMVGAIAFFSFGVAPVIFKVLKPDSAAQFVRALFPRYYAWGAIFGAVALPCLVCGTLAVPELRGYAVGIQAVLLLLCILIMLYCGNVLTPAINAARDAGPEAQAYFDTLHHRSVNLNSVVLLLGMALIVCHATRPTPKSEGIVQSTQEEYVRRSLQMMKQSQEFWDKFKSGQHAKQQTEAELGGEVIDPATPTPRPQSTVDTYPVRRPRKEEPGSRR